MPYDFPPITIDNNQLAEFSKIHGKYRKLGRQEAKPRECLLCGKPRTSYCNSHSLPQLCLRRIASGGKVLTPAHILETNLLKSTLGINQAGTFRLICNDCDRTYFRLYENPDSWDKPPTQQMLGQIAVKICLTEIAKAQEQIPFHRHLAIDYKNLLPIIRADVRTIDTKDDYRNLDLARRAAESHYRAFKTIFYKQLQYVTPVAFQIAVNPIVDFEGNIINNLFENEQSYYIEPLYMCVLPMATTTHILLFRNRRTSRYNDFENQINAICTDRILEAILKIGMAYSEELYYSPLIGSLIKEDLNIKQLTAMNIDSIAPFAKGKTKQAIIRSLISAAGIRYSINNWPQITNLLAENYAIEGEGQS